MKCPACSNAYSEDNVRMDYKIKKYDGEKIYTFICADCNQDAWKFSAVIKLCDKYWLNMWLIYDQMIFFKLQNMIEN